MKPTNWTVVPCSCGDAVCQSAMIPGVVMHQGALDREQAEEIVKARNAYTKLVETLRAVAGSHVSQYGKDRGICYVRPETDALVRATLRDLGETS